MVTKTLWLREVPKCDFLSPSPFPYGDSPYGYGDCVFDHPFSRALNNIFFAKASHVHTSEHTILHIWYYIAHSH